MENTLFRIKGENISGFQIVVVILEAKIIAMAKEKVRLWDRLKYKYKLSIQNETSYEEVFSMRLSQLHVLMTLSVIAVILITLTTLLIAFTGLKEFIPGYPDGNMRKLITENALRVDSLEVELKKRDRFLASIQMILRGEDHTQIEEEKNDSIKNILIKSKIIRIYSCLCNSN